MSIFTKIKMFLYKILAFLWIVALGYLLLVVNKGKPEEQVVLLLVILVSFAVFWYSLKSDVERKIPDAFLNQLKENKETIMSVGWKYSDHLIKEDTIITQFYFVFSLVTVSTKIPSRFYIVDYERTAMVNFIYTFFSLILGWWSIPYGPVFTLQALYTNLKGGNKIRVGDLINT